MTIIISHKNNLLFKNKDNKITVLPLKDATTKNLPAGKLDFRINKQWLTVTNRYKIELLSKGHKITNNTIYPALDTTTQYENVLNFVSTKKAAIELSADDQKILTTLLNKYNASSIKKQIIKLSIKL